LAFRRNAMVETKIVVGLGNPGTEYVGTRHNIGFQVIDELSKSLKIEVRKKKFGGAFGLGEFFDKRLMLFKPLRYMNRSGEPVATAMGFYKIGLSDLLVVSDDMALDPGRIRLRTKGSCGGHNGLADIVGALGTDEVSRLRIGIGRSGEGDAVGFVLGKPSKADRDAITDSIARACEAVLCWIRYDIETAMNRYN
jgi:PTH1 family peptidyl-tRNA hydrolase